MDNKRMPLRNIGSWQSSHCMLPNINEGCEKYMGFTKKNTLVMFYLKCAISNTLFFFIRVEKNG